VWDVDLRIQEPEPPGFKIGAGTVGHNLSLKKVERL
jgi:hypothetical protein